MFCECISHISRQEVIPSHQLFGCQDSPWCGIQPADLWSSRQHCDSEFEPPQKVTEKYWKYIGKSWQVVKKKRKRTSREPKAKSVKQPTSPLFQQGQATNIFEYCRVYARPRKPSKNCRPQTGRQLLSFTHMKSLCLIHKAWLSLAE